MIDATPLLKIAARRRLKALQAQDPAETQAAELMKLLRWARDTAFGRAHGFSNLRTVADFQRAVPIRSYEDFWSDWWQKPFPKHRNITSPGKTTWFAVTSGTTSGATKYIPVTDRMVAANKRAAIDVVTHHLANHPDSRPLSGRTFMMGGSTDLVEEAPGVFSGDLSGIAIKTQSLWTKPYAWPPTETALLEDWQEKLDRFVEDGFEQNIAIWTGVPSWMLILLERMQEVSDGRQPFPNLELLIHGGVAWDLYRERFAPFLKQTGVATREVYPASEGFIAVADRADGEGLRLIIDNGIFFEFVPLAELGSDNPTRHWAGTIEPGIDYAVVLSSCAGLYAYLLGDTVRFVDTSPPRLLITGRTSYMLSAFGEHLIGSEIERAVNVAAQAQSVQIIEFSVGPVLSEGTGGKGGHVYIVETGNAADAGKLSADIDRALCQANDDYRAHRSGGTGMEAPVVRLVPEGSFRHWMASKGKLGGQHKVPRVISDPAKFAAMLDDFDRIAADQRR
ncbi:GH3 family domain-containing protein [Minwuia sp.]|uniref:GH3 family domain-containing protein n=1 Tax=Minwuia sp. TaxID=2493630 RepID=UPI003A8F6BC7